MIFRPGRLKKTGSLQLSINAIVILILAITILGLGLGFIRKQFGSVTERFEKVGEQIEKQLVDEIKKSGELLVFDRVRIETQVGAPNNFYIGIKNTDNFEKCYQTQFRCIQPLETDYCDPSTNSNNVDVGKAGLKWFKTFDTVDIQPGGVEVLPVTLLISSANRDTYNVEIAVSKGDGDCASASAFSTYQSKRFYIVVK